MLFGGKVRWFAALHVFCVAALAEEATICGTLLSRLIRADVPVTTVPRRSGGPDYRLEGGPRRAQTPQGYLPAMAAKLSARDIDILFSNIVASSDGTAGLFAAPRSVYAPHDTLIAPRITPAMLHELRHALFFKELWALREGQSPEALPKREWDPKDRSLAHGTIALRFRGQKFADKNIDAKYGARGHGIDELLYAYGFEIPIQLSRAKRGDETARTDGLHALSVLRALVAEDRAALATWKSDSPVTVDPDLGLYDSTVTLSNGITVDWNSRQAERRMESWGFPNKTTSIPKLVDEQLKELETKCAEWEREFAALRP